MAKGDKKGSNNADSRNEPVTKDSRFKSVHNDPRFNLPNLKNFKIKVDERFSRKELKKLNAGATGKHVKIDRYGRKLKDEDSTKALEKFYEHEEDEEEEVDEKEIEESDDDDDEEEEESDESEVEDVEAILDRARGEGIASASEDEASSESESDSDSDSEDEVELDEDSEIEVEEGKPEEGEPSSGFAVVNMDWDNLKAVDLMATFVSFVPAGGSIKSITIYPSEFGKEQMQKEEIEGPPRDLFKSKKKKVESDSDSDDDEIDVNNKDDLERAARKLYEEDDGEEDYDSKALRRYQLQRLRYYYAVVKCDSVSTAKKIYDNCDGTEYESTANIFDLRYIPEDMEFDESEAKDICTKVSSSYKPDSTFVTDALQHSKVKLTWDETPKDRLTLSSRPLSQKEIDEMDFKAYLASDSDGSDAEDSSLKDKYKNLLGGSFGSFGKKGSKDDEDDEDDIDMEITFAPGLKNEEEKKPEPEQEKDESTIDSYKRKEKERRKRRLAKLKETQQAEKEKKNEENGVDSKAKDKKNKNKNKKHNIVDEKSKAELELLMMDDESKEEHFNMKDVIKAEKQKSKKNKKGRKNIDTELTQDKFEADLNDPRFNEIFENHDYAIDPTNSEFKKTETMKKILNERSKRNRDETNNKDNRQNKKHHKNNQNSNNKNGGNDEVGSLVNKIKSKYRK
ncbi:hypothetical protein DFJ63DRAFT_232048 [Scheffersomyces coipomensis]|uniref:uncharacterized protein n=1 Tax=Scheffersomyces coipomensis TaxID=1788519 RepID=UPI00315CA5D2